MLIACVRVSVIFRWAAWPPVLIGTYVLCLYVGLCAAFVSTILLHPPLIFWTLFAVSEAIFVITSAEKDVCGKPLTERLFLDKYGKICLCVDEVVWAVRGIVFMFWTIKIFVTWSSHTWDEACRGPYSAKKIYFFIKNYQCDEKPHFFFFELIDENVWFRFCLVLSFLKKHVLYLYLK